MDKEYYSICCNALPMYTLDDNIIFLEPIGICSHCREHTTFEIMEE